MRYGCCWRRGYFCKRRAGSGTGPDCRGPQFRDPGGWGVITFSNGAKAFVNASQAAKLPFGVRVVGSEGQLSIQKNRAILELWDGTTRMISSEHKQSSMHRAIDDIVQGLTSDHRPASWGADGLAALEMIIGFHLSDRFSGQLVQLPIADEYRGFEVRMG